MNGTEGTVTFTVRPGRTQLREDDHLETLISAAEGETVSETAIRWGCSERAVAKRRQAAVLWIGARNITHAVALAFWRGKLHAKAERPDRSRASLHQTEGISSEGLTSSGATVTSRR